MDGPRRRASSLSVDGELKFKTQPDYEDPTDANTDNVYEVTVQATDGNGRPGHAGR